MLENHILLNFKSGSSGSGQCRSVWTMLWIYMCHWEGTFSICRLDCDLYCRVVQLV